MIQFLFFLLFMIYQEKISCSDSNKTTTYKSKRYSIYEKELYHLKNEISKILPTDSKKCHYYPGNALDDFFDDRWKEKLSNFKLGPVLAYAPCMSAYNLGNSLGNYFNQIACAVESNTYIVITVKLWDYPFMPFEFKGNHHNHHHKSGITPNTKMLDKHDLTFFNSLPDVFGPMISSSLSSSPTNTSRKNTISITNIDKIDKKHASLADAKEVVRKVCACERFCWSNAQAPWIKQYRLIGQLMNEALDVHIEANAALIAKGTRLKSGSDDGEISSISPNVLPDTFIPTIPDVAIQYRCGDTVPSEIYGFLTFPTLVSLIPNDTKTIFVLTDHPHRASILGGDKPFSHKCPNILSEMSIYLQDRFPNAAIIIKRGGDAFLDYLRLARARVTICSASTFCIWPALASRTIAHFPVTGLVAGWSVKNPNTPYLGEHFRWLSHPRIVTEFKAQTPLKEVLEVLTEARNRSSI